VSRLPSPPGAQNTFVILSFPLRTPFYVAVVVCTPSPIGCKGDYGFNYRVFFLRRSVLVYHGFPSFCLLNALLKPFFFFKGFFSVSSLTKTSPCLPPWVPPGIVEDFYGFNPTYNPSLPPHASTVATLPIRTSALCPLQLFPPLFSLAHLSTFSSFCVPADTQVLQSYISPLSPPRVCPPFFLLGIQLFFPRFAFSLFRGGS